MALPPLPPRFPGDTRRPLAPSGRRTEQSPQAPQLGLLCTVHVAGEASGQRVPVHSAVWGDPKLDSGFRLREEGDPALPQVNVLVHLQAAAGMGGACPRPLGGAGPRRLPARAPRPPVRLPRSTPGAGTRGCASSARASRSGRTDRAALTRGAQPAGSGRGAYWGACEPQPRRDGTALPSGPRASGTGNPSSSRAGPSGGRRRGQPHASELPLAACGSGEPIPTGLHARLWDYFRFRVTPCPALPASLARPGQDGGVRARALVSRPVSSPGPARPPSLSSVSGLPGRRRRPGTRGRRGLKRPVGSPSAGLPHAAPRDLAVDGA